jgi:monofunctional biosynthetic peptidoglycan transglycosylase
VSRKRTTPAEKKPRRRWRRWLLILLLTPIVLSILLVLLFRFVNPPISGVMLERLVEARAAGDTDFHLRRRWCRFGDFGAYLPVAVIASEDQRFIEHFGFDTVEMAKAIEDAEDGERMRGASTISQQVAKNLFLWSGRSWVRKGLEAYFTLLIEVAWPKRRILETYLNIAETGDGMFGFCDACVARFGKSCAEIGPYNLALLVATLPNPRKWRADKATPYLHRRATWIVRQMEQLGGPQVLQRLEGNAKE